MSSDTQRVTLLKAWLHWKKKEKGLNENDLEFVQSIEDVISQVGNYKTRFEALKMNLLKEKNAFVDREKDLTNRLQKACEMLRKCLEMMEFERIQVTGVHETILEEIEGSLGCVTSSSPPDDQL